MKLKTERQKQVLEYIWVAFLVLAAGFVSKLPNSTYIYHPVRTKRSKDLCEAMEASPMLPTSKHSL